MAAKTEGAGGSWFVGLFRKFDGWFISFMSGNSINFLRIALAVIYIWFGALKIVGFNPAAGLVAQTVFWLPPEWAVVFIGA